jgi:hypothetical protein
MLRRTLRRWIATMAWLALASLSLGPLPARAISGGVLAGDDPELSALAFVSAIAPDGQRAYAASGTLIAPDFVLTAAHVIEDLNRLPRDHSVRVEIAGQVHDVARLFAHPDASAIDLGLIQLASRVDGVEPMPLLESPDPGLRGEAVSILGFGLPEVGLLQVGSARVSDVQSRTVILSGPAVTQSGDSGGPTLIESAGGPAILSVHSAFIGDSSFDVIPDRSFIDSLSGMQARWVTRLPSSAQNSAPVALPQTLTVEAGTPLPIVLRADDRDRDALGFAIEVQPLHGVLSGTPPLVTYTPDPGYVGPDAFRFVASDGRALSASAEVELEIVRVDPEPAPFATLAYRIAAFGWDRDTILLGRARGTVRELEIEALGAPLEFHAILIRFTDGGQRWLFPRVRLAPGSSSGALEIGGGARPVHRLELFYRSPDRQAGRALVAIRGR